MRRARPSMAWRRSGVRRVASDAGASPLRRLLDEASAWGEAAPAAAPELQWATQPYAAPAPGRARVAADPRAAAVLLFPGEGSAHVGMGLRLRDVPAARDLYDLASTVVGWDVWRTCTEGPEEELRLRRQTCSLVTSLAALERVRDERPAAMERVQAVAGFSLGELAALCFAGALPFEAAVRLAELRAAAMRAASAERAGGTLTVWPAPDARLPAALQAAREHATERGVEDAVCAVAAYLHPGCKAVAGDEVALCWLERHAREFGLRRAARVAGAGAAHCALMASAGEALRRGLAGVRVAAPRVGVVSAADGRRVRDGAAAARAVWRGVAAPVRWEQALHALYSRAAGAHFPLSLALGPGAALRSSLRQVNARAWDSSLQIDV